MFVRRRRRRRDSRYNLTPYRWLTCLKTGSVTLTNLVLLDGYSKSQNVRYQGDGLTN